jgi:hypothetical protein
MTDKQAKLPPGQVWWRLALRLAVFLLAAILIGGVLNRVAGSLDHGSHPAGFARGVLQGALMPMSMPNLLVGRDITIYSANNTGVSYKLGYTTGVNACGAVFFGVVFWRLLRLRKWANATKNGD